MMQNMYLAYLRGFDNKPRRGGVKGSLVYKEYYKGKTDRRNNKPNRYLK